MKELTEPLLPDTHHASVEKTADKKSVTLIRFVTVGTITLATFLLFIIILASQLPSQQTMGRTTVGSQELFTRREGWVRTIYGEYRLLHHQCGEGCDFDQAAAACEDQGGHLPFIQSDEEDEEIQKILSATGRPAWVGLISKYRRGSWQLYRTEDAATYFNFAQDDTEDDDARCVIIGGGDGEGKWRRTDCDRRKVTSLGAIGVMCQRLPAAAADGMDRRVMMGKSACDDAEKGIDRDLKNMKRETECDSKHNIEDRIVTLKEGKETSKEHCDDIHEKYVPNHICMDKAVNYSGFGLIPTHGPHRPNWASFGEYSFLPMERWEHNLEHGCVVMLYHPCMHKDQVMRMKSVLSGCLRKHIITPSRLPSLQRPVILLAWGCYLELEFNDLDRVRLFITTHGLGGPEGNYTKDGLYTHLQVAKADKTQGEDRVHC